MCGILCAFELKQSSESIRPQILEMSKKLRHRGPDWSGIYAMDKAIMSHERLAIVDPTSGKQPLISPSEKLILAANGEIYNHRDLRKALSGSYAFKTQSDCEVLLALYQEEGIDFLNKVNGIFAFAIYDAEKELSHYIWDGMVTEHFTWHQS
jgi:asparagine synthase (glutamine-hydrolysing)